MDEVLAGLGDVDKNSGQEFERADELALALALSVGATSQGDKAAERKLGYFAIPVLLKYGALGRQLHLGVGPQIGFLLSANDKFQGVINNQITVDEDIEEGLNSTDAGVVFNLSYKFRPSYGTGINVRYYLGLTDIIKDNPGDAVYNRVLSIFVSLAIGDDPSESD